MYSASGVLLGMFTEADRSAFMQQTMTEYQRSHPECSERVSRRQARIRWARRVRRSLGSDRKYLCDFYVPPKNCVVSQSEK